MKIIRLFITALVLLSVTSCFKTNKTTSTQETEETTTPKDSTIYGKLALDEMGQSTFAIRPEGTDTVLQLVLDNADGSAEIFGAKEEGSRWAITIRRRGTAEEALGRAYNLTQLNKFTKACHIDNGNLVLNDSDKVEVISMDDDSLVYREPNGHVDRFYKNRGY